MAAATVGSFAIAPAHAGDAAGQGTAKPAAGRGAQQAAGRGGLALQVTDSRGATLGGVGVALTGPSDRSGETNASGQLSFTGLQAGAYRLRFTGEAVTAFEREITLAAGRTATVDITLNPAPPPREVITEAPPPPPGPRGAPLTLSIPDLLDEEFVGREPGRETLLSCSGDLRTTMVQLNEPQPDRLYAESEIAYYVLGGEGTVTMDGTGRSIQTNDFVSVPRGTLHALARRGNRPLVLLATLSGVPCEQAR
jgi:mannose-6-phosphate isomerase-like protein (cupin superfamily)